MFEQIIKSLKKFFMVESHYESLEAYIVAGNPQDVNDVDRLEREFYEKRKFITSDRYF